MKFTLSIKNFNFIQDTLPFFTPEQSNQSPIDWLDEYNEDISNILSIYGCVLLRGFNINSLSEFNQFAQMFSPNLIDYVNRSTPRTRLGGKIYTSTEYPADQIIPLHNENSYTRKWPNHILFFCAIPAETGGETPIANSRSVINYIDPLIVKKFEEKKVLYVRNCGNGFDLPWQEVFQTDNPSEVEIYCVQNDIAFEWKDDHTVVCLSQVCQATLTHPKTHEKAWFNQAHLFNLKNQSEALQKFLLTEFGPDNLPRQSYYGDKTEIEKDVIDHINDMYEKAKICFKWERGDILILDNILTAHGRNSYTGQRKIAVAMS